MPLPVKSGPEFLVNATTNRDQFALNVIAVPDGRFVVVWASFPSLRP